MKKIIVLVILSISVCAMELPISVEQAKRIKEAEDNCLIAQLQALLPEKHVNSLHEDLPRILQNQPFNRPKVMGFEKVKLLIYSNPATIEIYRAVAMDRSNTCKISLTPEKFMELLSIMKNRIKNKAKTVD